MAEPDENGMFLEDGIWKCKNETGQTLVYDAVSETWVDPATLQRQAAPGLNSDETTDPAEASTSAGEGTETVGDTRNVNGTWVHRDPSSGIISTYSEKEEKWIPVPELEEEEEGKEEEEKGGEITDEGDDLAYQLNQEKVERRRKAREMREAREKGRIVYMDGKSGTIYEWEEGRKDWAPLVDDDFIARYQASYGITHEEWNVKPEGSESRPEQGSDQSQDVKKGKRKEPPKPAAWFDIDEQANRNIYVSNIPNDTTQEEFQELMSKCGLIAQDPRTRKFKLKLYRDSDGNLKGDGLCCYIKRESVELALNILDGYRLRDKELKVEAAKFEMKGEGYDPSKKKRKLSKKEKKDFLERQERLFDWRPDKSRTERPKSDSTVVLKNLFDKEEIIKDASQLLECQNDLEAECRKHGEVKKVVLYPANPEAVGTVTYTLPSMADDCVTMMDYRFFRKRQIRAALWDGKTKYKVEESEEEKKKRDEHWEQFLTS